MRKHPRCPSGPGPIAAESCLSLAEPGSAPRRRRWQGGGERRGVLPWRLLPTSEWGERGCWQPLIAPTWPAGPPVPARRSARPKGSVSGVKLTGRVAVIPVSCATEGAETSIVFATPTVKRKRDVPEPNVECPRVRNAQPRVLPHRELLQVEGQPSLGNLARQVVAAEVQPRQRV